MTSARIRVCVVAAATLGALLFAAPWARAQNDPLPSWNDGPTKKSITDFVAKVTKEGSPDLVKPAERIAVFDSTLWAEQPVVWVPVSAPRASAISSVHHSAFSF